MMGALARRGFRVGADVARFVSRGGRDAGIENRGPSLCGSLRPPLSSVANFTIDVLAHPRNLQRGRKENVLSFVGVGTVFILRRTVVVPPSRGRVFSGEGGVPGCPKFTAGWLTGIPKTKPAVASTGGGIGADVQVATASLVFGSSIGRTGLNGIYQTVRFYGNCYRQLSKAHLSSFVVSTAAVGYVMGSGAVVDWMGLAWTSLGTMLAASSANAFNQILEVANDGRMKRTMRRPLPAGRMSKAHALAFAVIAGITGVTLLAWKTSPVAAELGAANILLYSLVYTPLKQIHYINTWVGAVVGGIPPLLGWAAASGQVETGAWVLAAALYFWQIPHFMALAFLFRADYVAGGYKMLSVLDSSGKRTALCALRNCVYLLPLGFLAQYWGTTTGYFGAENLVLSAGIGATAALFYLQPSPESARKLFRTSLLYLPILMTAMVIHRIPNPNAKAYQFAEINADECGDSVNHRLVLLGGDPSTLDSESRKTSATLDLEPRKTSQHRRSRDLPQPPISLISAAPFPFLPAPDYS